MHCKAFLGWKSLRYHLETDESKMKYDLIRAHGWVVKVILDFLCEIAKCLLSCLLIDPQVGYKNPQEFPKT